MKVFRRNGKLYAIRENPVEHPDWLTKAERKGEVISVEHTVTIGRSYPALMAMQGRVGSRAGFTSVPFIIGFQSSTGVRSTGIRSSNWITMIGEPSATLPDGPK